MTDAVEESSEVKETDIVFDCPHCGKSLAIDYRGAGLTIPCTDCGNYVEVPIPDGMDKRVQVDELHNVYLRSTDGQVLYLLTSG